MQETVRRVTRAVSVLHGAGVLRAESPLAFARFAKQMKRWGPGLGGAVAANAARDPRKVAMYDDLGPVTYSELDERSSRLASGLAARGFKEGDTAGLLCRDHRFFVEGAAAISKLGCNLVLMNTSFSGPQLRDVMTREEVKFLIHDEEFLPLAAEAPDVLSVVAWADGSVEGDSIESLISDAPAGHPDPPSEPGRVILLTSGTTGTPKGARRPTSTPVAAIIDLLDGIPFHHGDRHFVVAPLFHAWGFSHFGLCVLLGMEMIVRRRFDPEGTLEAIDKYRPRSAAMVPVMAQRILNLPEETRAKYNTSSLEIVALGGSAIPGDLAVRWMDEFGDNAYNTYGSTEVAIVSIAGPQDLRDDPATAGKIVSSAEVRLLDADGRPTQSGQPGRIFVGASASFDGYTGGGTKEQVDGLMSSGDMGSIDAKGRLRIEGRDDDMIVSGGENVYPREVEDLIATIGGVIEVAVIGVADDEFGQRLRAFVVREDDDAIGEDTIKDAVRSDLARYKVPREVIFLEELPRTSTGKILKRELTTT
ncbi:MAG: AMP-binding protein [Solirubrobacteraceae bacterium]|nr:AMP-binding protein [Solirubrobacteraceae bacterium]